MKPSSPAVGLHGRRILVTAGPTWAPIDAVRHIGNRSTGGTGLAIARSLCAAGARATLLFGPGTSRPDEQDRARFDILDFETFDDLHALIRERVGSGRYDAVIHAAAVSDYRPSAASGEKLSSDSEELVIRLVRTPKIVDEIKDLDPDTLLVKFKLEVARATEELLAIAEASRRHSRAELMVANDLSEMCAGRHHALLLDDSGVVAEVETTADLARQLSVTLARMLSIRPLRSSPE